MRKSSYLLSWTFLIVAAASLPARAEGDPVKGAEVFEEVCGVCHQIGADAENLVGPILNGVIGRKAGTYEEFEYGDSMAEAGTKGLVWDEEKILSYLPNPSEFLQKFLDDEDADSVMPPPEFEEEQDRLHLIAYIKTFKDEN